MIDLIRIERFCGLTGYSDDAVRGKISGGMWIEGVVWIKAPDSRILISIRGYEAWAAGVPSHTALKICDSNAASSGALLSLQELRELTDCALATEQIKWLVRRSWKFEVGATGNPKVARDEFEQRLVSGPPTKKIVPAEEPNWAALNAPLPRKMNFTRPPTRNTPRKKQP